MLNFNRINANKNTNILIVIWISLLALTSFNLNAGDFTGVIKDVASGPSVGTILMVAVDGTVNNKPACLINSYWDFSIDTQAVGAEAWVSMILTAFTTGKNVVLTGEGDCDNWHNVEDISSIRIMK